jgi:hypothetical protein
VAQGWQELVREAQEQVAAQQALAGEPWPLERTRQLVETSMLAAVTGLAYTLGSLLKLESYLAYLLPLPVVLAALRSGTVPALKTLATACLLLLSERRGRLWWEVCAATQRRGRGSDGPAPRQATQPPPSPPPPPRLRPRAVLMGPVRAVTYLLVYGLLSLTLGACWAARLPWVLSIPLGALARIGGYLAYIALSSWVTNENL